MIIIIPPSFRVLSNIGDFGMFVPNSIDIAGKCLNSEFESVNTLNNICVDTLDRTNKFFDKMRFLFTILDQRSSFCLNMFLNNRDVNSDRSMVQSESPVRMDVMIIMFI